MPSTDMGERFAAELDRVARLIEELGVTLCLDPVVFERHPGPLQRFDEVVQIITEIAGSLRSTGTPQEVIAAIRLEAMSIRMNSSDA